MRRGESMFDVDPSVHDEIAEGIKSEGSNLCGISADCSWEETNKKGTFKTILTSYFQFLNGF